MTIPAQITSAAPEVTFSGANPTSTFFNYDPRNVSAAAGSALIRFTMQFGKGHCPVGQLPVLKHMDGIDAGAVIQWDKLATVTDATSGVTSILSMTGRMLNPETLGAANGGSASIGYKWVLTTSTRNTTPAISIADITANTDYKLKISGDSYGSDTYTVSLNDILANFTGGAMPQDWGSRPLGGYEITESGPICLSLHAWRFLKRDSDGASHKWVRVDFYFTFWKCVSGDVRAHGWVYVSNPNVDGSAVGTIGASSLPGYLLGVYELYNGSSRVTASDFSGVAGGPLDTLTVTAAASGLSVNGTGLGGSLPAIQSYSYYTVTSSGSMPGGLTSGATYCLVVNGGVLHFYVNRNDPVGVNSSGAPATMTSVGSGTLTFTFKACGANGAGLVIRTTDGQNEPIWLGTGTRPAKLGHAFDFSYLTRGSRRVWPMDPTIKGIPAADASSYIPGVNSICPFGFNIEQTGDGSGDSRIGKVSFIHASHIYAQQNAAVGASARGLALCWADYQSRWIDPTRGRPVVGNNTTYSNLGAPRPTMVQINGSGGYAGFAANGYYYNYQQPVDASHLPVFGYWPYLWTGDDVYLAILADVWSAYASLSYKRHQNGPTGTTYYCVSTSTAQQARGIGWGTHLYGSMRAVCPDNHALHPYVVDTYAASAAYYRDWAFHGPGYAQAQNEGGLNWPLKVQANAGDPSHGEQLWMYHFINGAILHQVWADIDPNWRDAVFNAKAYTSMTDLFLPEKGGRMFEIGCTAWPVTNHPYANEAPTIAGFWAACNDEQTGTVLNNSVYPDQWSDSSGIACRPEFSPMWVGTATNRSDQTNWPSLGQMGVEMADIVGAPNARPVAARYRARVARNGGMNLAGDPTHSVQNWAT